jgi:hypothetical protein
LSIGAGSNFGATTSTAMTTASPAPSAGCAGSVLIVGLRGLGRLGRLKSFGNGQRRVYSLGRDVSGCAPISLATILPLFWALILSLILFLAGA